MAVALFNAVTAPMLKKSHNLQACPRVSVLIPARNEEGNIGACIEGFLSQKYDNFEILALDDQSTDQTGAIIEAFGAQHLEVQAIRGNPLPAGWLGKNWACHQLSQHASGEILIFTDADNRPAPNAIVNTVGYMQQLELGLLSAFPEKVTGTLAEKARCAGSGYVRLCRTPVMADILQPFSVTCRCERALDRFHTRSVSTGRGPSSSIKSNC